MLANSMLRKCIFLLKIEPSFEHQSITTEENEVIILAREKTNESIVNNSGGENLTGALNVVRSISCQVDEKNVNKNKLENFRNWIDSYQKWKLWKHCLNEAEEEKSHQEGFAPIKSISTFLKAKINTKNLELCLREQSKRAAFRFIGMQCSVKLFNLVNETFFEKYFVGVFSELFQSDLCQNIKCVPIAINNLSIIPFNENLKILIEMFNKKSKNLSELQMNKLSSQIMNIKSTAKVFSLDSLIQEHFKLIYLILLEISSLISNKMLFWNNSNLLLKIFQKDECGIIFIKNIIEMALLCHNFLYLSVNFEDAIFLANQIIQIIMLIISKFVENLNDSNLLNEILNLFIYFLEKEVGLENSNGNLSVNLKILQRVQDISCISRLIFLLSHLYEILIKQPKAAKMIENKSFILIFLIYNLNVPSVVRLTLRNLKLTIPTIYSEGFKTSYDVEFFKKVIDKKEGGPIVLNEELKSQQQKVINLKKVIVEIDKPKSIFPLNNLTYLFEKIGQNIMQNDSSNLKKKLKKEFNCNNNNDEDSEKKYAIVVHLAVEEDLMFLLKVLYYWEEMYPSFSLKFPKTVEQYLEIKEGKNHKINEEKNNINQENKNKHNQQQEIYNYSHVIFEKLLLNIPDINIVEEDENKLPLGWQFTYLNLYQDMKFHTLEFKKPKVKKNTKKPWTNANLNKYLKKYEDLAKNFEEFKEIEPAAEKLQNIQVYYYNKRNLLKKNCYFLIS